MKNFLAFLFKDTHSFWDEKKIWGFLYLVSSLVSVFFISSDPMLLLVIVCVGIALLFGVTIGDKVPAISAVQSLGILDLFTDKKNQSDLSRIFGNLFLLVGLLYYFMPLIKPQFNINPAILGIVVVVGCALFGVSLYGDKEAACGIQK